MSDSKRDSSDDESDVKEEKHADGDHEDKGDDEHDLVATLGVTLKGFHLSEELADVHFVIGKERIAAHRFVLAAQSDVLRAMLCPLNFSADGKTASYQTSGDFKDLALDDLKNPAAFKRMLESLYNDDFELEESEVPEQLELARKFQLDGLRVACVSFLETDVTVETACQRMLDGRTLLNEPGFGLSFIEENTADVIETAAFNALPRDCLVTICGSNKLNVIEVDLFNAVHKWAKAECARRKLDPTPANKREVLGPVLNLIRFPLMEMDEIVAKVQQTGLLEPQELLSLFTYKGAQGKTKVAWSAKERGGGGGRVEFEVKKCPASLRLSNKNRVITKCDTSNWTGNIQCTLPPVKKGKRSFKVKVLTSASSQVMVGFAPPGLPASGAIYNSQGYYFYMCGGTLYSQNGQSGNAYSHASVTTGQTLECVYDVKKQTISYIVNGQDKGVAYSNVPDKWLPSFCFYDMNLSLELLDK